MKKYIIAVICFLSLFAHSYADSNVKIEVNGEKTETDAFINSDNRTMVPIYFVGSALGAEVEYCADGENTATVKMQSDTVIIKIGTNKCVLNGEEKSFDTRSVIKNDRTFVPVRFISEMLGAEVSFDEESGTVIIKSAKKEPIERKLNNDAVSDVEEVCVTDFGADPNGIKNSTSDIRCAHNSGKRVYYPNGTYIFTGKTLNFSGGVRFESPDGVKIRNLISDEPIVNFDDFGNLIGLKQNHLESYNKGQKDFMEVGSLVAPPLSEAEYDTKVDFMPMWYNDFGLESTRLAQYGSPTWYYWLWCYHNAGDGNPDPRYAYNPERNPLLGYYKGDDPIVLDWICYWLKEYGAKGVMLYATPTPNTGFAAEWENEESSKHWMYVLFNEVENFKKMKYILTLSAAYLPGTTVSDETTMKPVRDDWFNVIDNVYLKYDNCYCIEKDGKRYPVIYIHETKALPGAFDSYKDFKNSADFLAQCADRFKAAGYGGAAFICRHPDEKMYAYREELEEKGVIFYDGDYSGTYGTGENYRELVENYNPPTNPYTVLNTATGHYTVGPHPSKWNIGGETPELFGEMMSKAVEHIYKYNLPKIVTCYNISEWSEGGPGLIPNTKNRFAYLDAFKEAIMK